MATIKKQAGRALEVIPSQLCDVPFPCMVAFGYFSSIGSYNDYLTMVDPFANFISAGVKAGDIVYFTGSVNVPTVVALVVDQHTLAVVAESGTLSESSDYVVYGGPNNGGSSDGCVLYVGTGGSLSIVTVGGDSVTLDYVPNGVYLPIQVSAVRPLEFGSASNIVAFW